MPAETLFISYITFLRFTSPQCRNSDLQVVRLACFEAAGEGGSVLRCKDWWVWQELLSHRV